MTTHPARSDKRAAEWKTSPPAHRRLMNGRPVTPLPCQDGRRPRAGGHAMRRPVSRVPAGWLKRRTCDDGLAGVTKTSTTTDSGRSASVAAAAVDAGASRSLGAAAVVAAGSAAASEWCLRNRRSSLTLRRRCTQGPSRPHDVVAATSCRRQQKQQAARQWYSRRPGRQATHDRQITGLPARDEAQAD